HTRFSRDWSSDVCSSDLGTADDSPGLGERLVADQAGLVLMNTHYIENQFHTASFLKSLATLDRVRLTQRAIIAVVIGVIAGATEIGRASCRERGGDGGRG